MRVCSQVIGSELEVDEVIAGECAQEGDPKHDQGRHGPPQRGRQGHALGDVKACKLRHEKHDNQDQPLNYQKLGLYLRERKSKPGGDARDDLTGDLERW